METLLRILISALLWMIPEILTVSSTGQIFRRLAAFGESMALVTMAAGGLTSSVCVCAWSATGRGRM